MHEGRRRNVKPTPGASDDGALLAKCGDLIVAAPELAQDLLGVLAVLGRHRAHFPGRAVEVDAIFGEPLRRGQKLGVKMLELEKLYEQVEKAAAHRRLH